MHTVGVRDLRGNVAALVKQAEAGERIVVTVSGRAVAQLGPLDPTTGAASVTLTDLAARGLLVPARRADRPRPDVVVPLRIGTRLDRLMTEVRG